jgi:predicted Zn finger-like uncharacterized protein
MKISCHSCGSKYTIADDKVRGRRVKVRCKSCGTPIVVDGAEPQPAEEPPNVASTPGAEGFSEQPPVAQPGADPWSVNLSDTDQRSMTTEEIVAGWSSGLVTEDAFAWKEGMDDWIPVHEVPELKPLLGRRSQPAPPAAFAAPIAAPVTSARLSGGRTQGAADLFGAVDSAGSEEEVATSAPAAPAMLPGATAYDAKPSGQRNENSVLFSLDALKVGFSAPATPSPSPARKAAPPPRRAAMQSAPDDPFGMSAGNSGVARLGGGGGMFGMGDQQALLFAPAAPEPPPPPPPSADPIAVQYASVPPPPARGFTQKQKLIAGGAGALVVLLLIVIVVASSGKKDESVAKNESAKTESTKSDEKPRDDKGSKKDDEAPKAAAEKSEGETKPTESAEAAEKKPLTEEEKKRFAEAKKKEEEKKAEEATKAEALKKAAEVPAGSADAPAFNKGAAISALSSSASAASGCKRPGGPTGTGKAVVTFAPSGRVTSANITGGSFGGSPVGGCVSSVFRRAKVPAFSGNAVTVSKSFTISP